MRAAPAAPRNCVLRQVAEAMERVPVLEAVRFSRAAGTISFATLGREVGQQWQEPLAEELSRTSAGTDPGACGLVVQGQACANCSLDAGHRLRAGLRVSAQDGEVTVARERCPTAPSFWRWRPIPWPVLTSRRVVLPEETQGGEDWRWPLAAAVVCGLLTLTAAVVDEPVLRQILFVAAYVSGGWFAAHEVIERLRERVLDVHFLMLVVALGSAAIGAWGEGAILLFLFSISGALEHYAMGRTQREIQALFHTAPKTAIRLDPGGHETSVTVESLAPGMRILVKPGELFPVDVELTRGRTAADESNLTGEAVPVAKAEGDTALGGTVNLWGAVEAMVLRPASGSSLQRMIELIREAQHAKAPSQRFTDRFGTRYTYAILGLTAVMYFVWWLGLGHAPAIGSADRPSAFYLAMTLLVVTSPCALVLSIPSAILAAIAWAARRGILFRGGAAVEKLAEVRVVAMDKTGTLTTGDLRVERVESFPAGREAEVLRCAFAIERLTTHPLARAICRHAKQAHLDPEPVEQVESVAGDGVRGMLRGQALRVGRASWVGLETPEARAAAAAQERTLGLSEVWVRHGELTGRVVLRDEVRAAARPLLEELRAAGLRTVVLTGDRREAADALGRELALEDVRSGLSPADKVKAIRELEAAGQRLAMIGDGVNDAASLAAAYVGVAMGGRGSAATLEQADVVLMHDRLENFLAAYRLSQRARRVIRQNLAVSLGTVVLLGLGALAGVVPLTAGVVGHEGSTVVVVLNSLRLLVTGPSAKKGPLSRNARVEAEAPGDEASSV